MTTELIHTSDVPLETGWTAATPDGDNVVLAAGRAMQSAYAALATAGGHRTGGIDALGLHLTDTGSPSPFGNAAHLLQPLDPVTTDRAVAAITDFYRAAPGGSVILFSTWPTADLTGSGLSRVGHPPLMVRWQPVDPRPTSGLDVRTASSAAELVDFEQTLVEGYPSKELWPYRPRCFLDPAVLDTGWRFVVGYERGEPVACAAAFPTPAVTLIEMVATRPEARGRGYGAILTAAAEAAASDGEGVPGVLLASDDGWGVYARLGYRSVMRFTVWAGARGGLSSR